jgi:hypothetical protein
MRLQLKQLCHSLEKSQVAGSGIAQVADQFNHRLLRSGVPTAPDLNSVVETMEDPPYEVRLRYEPLFRTENGASNYGFHALVMGLEKFDNGDPYVRLVSGEGIAGLTALPLLIST